MLTTVEGGKHFTMKECSLVIEESGVCFSTFSEDHALPRERIIWKTLSSKIDDAQTRKFSCKAATKIKCLLKQKSNCFRLVLARDPSVDVAPLRVRLN